MIELKNISKVYQLKSGNIDAVKGVSLTVNDGEINGIISYSGAGKSTLVRCINLLEVPDSGDITVNGTKITWTDSEGRFNHLSNHDMKTVRKGIGMIFQHFNLLDRSTVFDNIAYPLKYSGLNSEQIKKRVFELLNLVDLTDKADVYPAQLSGGQKQRVAIARAIANNPQVLLSDEATSALDPDATESILNLLKELNRKLGLTIVLITHEMSVIKSICTKVAVMEKGSVVEEGDVYSIFAEPAQVITKKFIASQSSLSKISSIGKKGFIDLSDGARLIKLRFLKNAVGDALISEISRRFNVNLNIVLANVDIIQDFPLGEIIVVIKGEPDNIAQAIEFLKSQNVKAYDLTEEK